MFVRVKRPTKINPLPPLDLRGSKKKSESPAKPDIDIDKLSPAKIPELLAPKVEEEEFEVVKSEAELEVCGFCEVSEEVKYYHANYQALCFTIILFGVCYIS